MIPALDMDFDTVMDAIGSNTGRFGYSDVAIEVRRTRDSLVRAKPRRAVDGETEAPDEGYYPVRAPQDNF